MVVWQMCTIFADGSDDDETVRYKRTDYLGGTISPGEVPVYRIPDDIVFQPHFIRLVQP